MKIYRVKVEQRMDGMLVNREAFDLRARSATEALRRALSLARKNGFLKSRPLEVKSLEEISANVQ